MELLQRVSSSLGFILRAARNLFLAIVGYFYPLRAKLFCLFFRSGSGSVEAANLSLSLSLSFYFFLFFFLSADTVERSGSHGEGEASDDVTAAAADWPAPSTCRADVLARCARRLCCSRSFVCFSPQGCRRTTDSYRVFLFCFFTGFYRVLLGSGGLLCHRLASSISVVVACANE